MISLKDYAAQKNITYEAVRKSVARYKDELDGHIIKVDRKQYLDDEAVAFLDDKRQKNPVVIIQQDKDEQIEQLRRENNQLKNELLAAQKAMLDQKDEILRLKDENHALLTAGKPQAELEPECQDETAIDVEPGDPEPEAELTESLVGVVPEPEEPGFWQRLRYAFTGKW